MSFLAPARDRDSQAGGRWPYAAAAIGVPLAYYVRFGYRFGYSDQDEFLPWVLSRLDSGLYATDWFVGSQLQGFNIRSAFVATLTPLASLLGLPGAVLLVQIVSVSLLVIVLVAIARSLGLSALGTAAAPLLILAVIPRWTIGGNALTSSMLVPSTVAWALCLAAVALLLRRKYLLAGALVGVAAWAQFLVAAQVGGMALVALLWHRERSLKAVMAYSIPAMGLALPLVFLITSGTGSPSSASFELISAIRAPHHYLPSKFPPADYARFALLVSLGLASWRRGEGRAGRRDSGNRAKPLGEGLLLGAVIALAVGGLSSAFSWEFILLLQPFKSSVLASVLLGMAVCSHIPRVSLPNWAIWSTIALPVLIWVALILGFQTGGKPPQDPGMGPLIAVAEWASENTGRSESFAVPPSTSGFRFHSKRAIVVNFKAYVFSDEGIDQWKRRLSDWAPGVMAGYSGPGGTAILAPMDSAYESIQGPLADSLAQAYNVRYIVRATAMATADSLFQMLPLRGNMYVYKRRSP